MKSEEVEKCVLFLIEIWLNDCYYLLILPCGKRNNDNMLRDVFCCFINECMMYLITEWSTVLFSFSLLFCLSLGLDLIQE